MGRAFVQYYSELLGTESTATGAVDEVIIAMGTSLTASKGMQLMDPISDECFIEHTWQQKSRVGWFY